MRFVSVLFSSQVVVYVKFFTVIVSCAVQICTVGEKINWTPFKNYFKIELELFVQILERLVYWITCKKVFVPSELVLSHENSS